MNEENLFLVLLDKAPKGITLREFHLWMMEKIYFLWQEGLVSNMEFQELMGKMIQHKLNTLKL